MCIRLSIDVSLVVECDVFSVSIQSSSSKPGQWTATFASRTTESAKAGISFKALKVPRD